MVICGEAVVRDGREDLHDFPFIIRLKSEPYALPFRKQINSIEGKWSLSLITVVRIKIEKVGKILGIVNALHLTQACRVHRDVEQIGLSLIGDKKTTQHGVPWAVLLRGS